MVILPEATFCKPFRHSGIGIVLLTLLALLGATPAFANLTAEADRTEIHENDTLQLRVVGETDISFDLSTLMNLSSLQLPAPDLGELENSFRVLDTNQSYSIRTVNGDTQAMVTWTYQLAPLRTGQLQIPALKFKGDTSNPIMITVKSGDAPATGPREAYIELSADKDSVYVQEQIQLTVRLFYQGDLVRGDLSEPTHPDAIIEKVGRQIETQRTVDGRLYQMVERQYAVFPQKPGTFSLLPITFEGRVRDNRGQLNFLRDSSSLFDVEVKPVPSSFTGDTWLPATSLTLSESGLPANNLLREGDNLTRTINLVARGLPGETLPDPHQPVPDALRSYPEPAKRDTNTRRDYVVGSVSQSVDLVAVKAGRITLPEIRIPWWDTQADEQRFAVIQPQELDIIPATGGSGQTSGGSSAQGLASASDSADESANAPETETDDAFGSDETQTSAGVWPWIAGGVTIAWLLTAAALVAVVRRRNSDTLNQSHQAQSSLWAQNEDALFQELVIATDQGSARVFQLLPRWYATLTGQPAKTVRDVTEAMDEPALKTQLESLRQQHYGDGSGDIGSWNRKEMVRHLQGWRERLKSAGASSEKDAQPLAPFYPNGFKP